MVLIKTITIIMQVMLLSKNTSHNIEFQSLASDETWAFSIFYESISIILKLEIEILIIFLSIMHSYHFKKRPTRLAAVPFAASAVSDKVLLSRTLLFLFLTGVGSGKFVSHLSSFLRTSALFGKEFSSSDSKNYKKQTISKHEA